MSKTLLIVILYFFICLNVFSEVYNIYTDEEITETMKWNCPNVDFTWTFHNYKLEEQPKESGEGKEIYEWIPPHYKYIEGSKKSFPGTMKVYSSDKEFVSIADSLKWEKLENNYLGTALSKGVLSDDGKQSVIFHFNGETVFGSIIELNVNRSPIGVFSTGSCTPLN